MCLGKVAGHLLGMLGILDIVSCGWVFFLAGEHCMKTDKPTFMENVVYGYVYLCVFMYERRKQSLFADFCFRFFLTWFYYHVLNLKSL